MIPGGAENRAQRPPLTGGPLPGNVNTVPHVELSVSDPHVARARRHLDFALDRWAATVASAEQPCLVIDEDEVIVAVSPGFADLVGLTEPVIGSGLLDGVLHLLDFANGGALTDAEIGKIPPLLALTSGGLARGLLKVSCAGGACTLDAIATPLIEDGRRVGSLTFFNPI